ncbi:MAG: cytochrome c oxidase assembly protein, partial [Pseudomonadota bacterium]
MPDQGTAKIPQLQNATQHRRVALLAGGLAIFMLAMAYAAVPLYQIFCQVTGFAGTTQRAMAAPETVLERSVTIRFDSYVTGGLGCTFKPVLANLDIEAWFNRLECPAEATGNIAVEANSYAALKHHAARHG